MKFTIEEMNVLVRGLYLALEEAKREDREYDTEFTHEYRALVSELYERIDDKLWKKIKKEDDMYWAERWEVETNIHPMMEPGADGMYDPIDETK